MGSYLGVGCHSHPPFVQRRGGGWSPNPPDRWDSAQSPSFQAPQILDRIPSKSKGLARRVSLVPIAGRKPATPMFVVSFRSPEIGSTRTVVGHRLKTNFSVFIITYANFTDFFSFLFFLLSTTQSPPPYCGYSHPSFNSFISSISFFSILPPCFPSPIPDVPTTFLPAIFLRELERIQNRPRRSRKVLRRQADVQKVAAGIRGLSGYTVDASQVPRPLSPLPPARQPLPPTSGVRTRGGGRKGSQTLAFPHPSLLRSEKPERRGSVLPVFKDPGFGGKGRGGGGRVVGSPFHTLSCSASSSWAKPLSPLIWRFQINSHQPPHRAGTNTAAGWASAFLLFPPNSPRRENEKVGEGGFTGLHNPPPSFGSKRE